MAHKSLVLYYVVAAASLTLVIASAAAISRKDKSWINWYSLQALQMVAMLYVLPCLFVSGSGATGGVFAYSYCYVTYACTSVCGALSYCYLKPLQLRRRERAGAGSFSAFPWLLLGAGFLLYLPVLLHFSSNLLQPREIYEGFSAAGYGLNFFGSAILTTLAYVSYLFKSKKNITGAVLFFAGCAVLIFLHGSKGQLAVMVFLGLLYRIYVLRRKMAFAPALLVLVSAGLLMTIVFAAFGTSTDIAELVSNMANYADGGRNAIRVIDDAELPSYQGRLELEDEAYSRLPRLLVPAKPRIFGQVRLAERYYPQWVRESAGTPNFGIGMQYADFGAATILVLSVAAVLTGWVVRSIVVSLEVGPSPGRFLILLFFSGVTIIPIGAGYLLPEVLVLAIALDLLRSQRFTLLKRLPFPALAAGESVVCNHDVSESAL